MHQVLFGDKRKVPKGTTDVVMERLFPQNRSSVPLDEERQFAVWRCLVEIGVVGNPTEE